jgi:hypothetical protein
MMSNTIIIGLLLIMQSEADIALGMDHIQRRLARLYKQAYKVKFCFPFLLIKIQHVEKKVLIFKPQILVCFVSVLRIRIRDPVTYWCPLVLGSGMGKKSRSGMNIPDLISESVEKILWVKNT